MGVIGDEGRDVVGKIKFGNYLIILMYCISL